MPDNMIELVAKLNEKESVKQIGEDLKKITPDINKLQVLKIKCHIDTAEINQIKEQITSVVKEIKSESQNINLGDSINNKNTSIAIKTITALNGNVVALKKHYQDLYNVKPENVTSRWVKNNNQELTGLCITVQKANGEIENLSHTISKTNEINLTGITGSDKGVIKQAADISKYISKTEKDLERFKSTHSSTAWLISEDIAKVNEALTELKSGSGSIATVEQSFNNLKKVMSEIESNFNSGRKSFNIDDSTMAKVQNLDNEIKQLELDIGKLGSSDAKNKVDSSFESVKKEIESLKKIRDSINSGENKSGIKWAEQYKIVNELLIDIQNNLKLAKAIDAKNGSSSLQKTKTILKEIEQQYRKINYYEQQSTKAGEFSSDKFSELKERSQSRINDLVKELSEKNLLDKNVQSAIEKYRQDLNDKREIRTANSFDKELAEQDKQYLEQKEGSLNKILDCYKKINEYEQKSINAKETEKNTYSELIDELEQKKRKLIKQTYKEGLLDEKSANQINLRKQELDTQRNIRSSRISDIEKTEQIKQQNKELKKQEEALNRLRKSEKELGSEISTSLNKLRSQSQNATFRNNSSDVNVQKQLSSISNLEEEYRSLNSLLSQSTDQEQYDEIREQLDKLSPKLKSVLESSKELQGSLRDNTTFETTSNRIKKLSADLGSYAKANKRAVSSTKQMSDGNTFAQKWEELSNKIAKGSELSVVELRHLTEEFAVFKKEAQSAGITGVSALDSFLDTFKKASTYISAQAVYGFAKQQISSMIQEVISLDSAMVNLRKVTNESDESYQEFIKSAQQQGKVLHATTSDVIEQSAEWAKLGYNLDEARKLSKVSTIYSKVGEIDNQSAVQDLVSAMKAFNVEASDGISIVDRLNKLGNEFATDSRSLGEGLRVSASALSAAGNDLDETLALITGGTEIVQDANQMGTALRTISMRIRGKKYASV